MFRRGFKTWCETTAVQVRKSLDIEAHEPLPPARLAETLRIPIWTPADLADLAPDAATRLASEHASAWSALTLPGARSKVIIRNPAHSPERSASDVMHELAHVLLEHEPGNVFFGPNGLALRTHNKDQEDEARWLSGCLLVPREALFRILKQRLSDDQACSRYGVSREMLTFRRQTSGVDRQFFRKPARGRSG
jgi:hypothetical protein